MEQTVENHDEHDDARRKWVIRSRFECLLTGCVLGALIGMGLNEFKITPLGGHVVLWCAVIGTFAGLRRRGRRAMWAVATFVTLFYFVIAYTPLMRALMPTVERSDALRHAPAVVVLGTSTHEDGTLGAMSQERFVHGYELLREGYAPRLVITNPVTTATFPGWAPAVEKQMKNLGLDYPVDLVGPVGTTYDEAVAVAKLAKERGWDSVLLVTHPWHMKRAGAVFEKAGLHVICSPCVEGTYDLDAMDSPEDQLGAWRYWSRETAAYWVYRLRGRI